MLRCLYILMLVYSSWLQAKDTVTWVTENFEPYYIQSGESAGKGIGDRLNAAIISKLPQYNHTSEYMPILRITKGLTEGAKIAVATYLKNPKDNAFAIYSITSLVVPPLELTLRESDWTQKWNRIKPISLKAFLAAGNVVGMAGRRYYGDSITPILLNKELYPNGTYVVESTHYQALADMVTLGRIDGTIGYTAELKFHQDSEAVIDKLVSVPIEENPDVLYAYVVAPNTDWGKEFIQNVNSALLTLRNTDEYRNIMFDWFGKDKAFVQEVNKRFASKE